MKTFSLVAFGLLSRKKKKNWEEAALGEKKQHRTSNLHPSHIHCAHLTTSGLQLIFHFLKMLVEEGANDSLALLQMKMYKKVCLYISNYYSRLNMHKHCYVLVVPVIIPEMLQIYIQPRSSQSFI